MVQEPANVFRHAFDVLFDKKSRIRLLNAFKFVLVLKFPHPTLDITWHNSLCFAWIEVILPKLTPSFSRLWIPLEDLKVFLGDEAISNVESEAFKYSWPSISFLAIYLHFQGVLKFLNLVLGPKKSHLL